MRYKHVYWAAGLSLGLVILLSALLPRGILVHSLNSPWIPTLIFSIYAYIILSGPVYVVRNAMRVLASHGIERRKHILYLSGHLAVWALSLWLWYTFIYNGDGN
jgi:hypothetical protein